MIELIDFCKQYGGKSAVENVTMTVNSGEITALLGENGAGKTTILRAVCALHFASAGIVRVCGSEDAESIKENTGYVPEIPVLYADFTVWEMLKYACEMRGIFGSAQKTAMERVIADCALESVLDKKTKTLSKGFSQRVSFAAALVHNPRVIVLDEPASGLDPSQIKQMRNLVKKLGKERTVLLSTHLMQEVDALAEKIFILKKGRIAASGTAAQIAQNTGCKTLEDSFIKLSES